MTKSEVARLFERIVNFYPFFSGDLPKVNAWHEFLKEIPFENALTNLNQHIATEKFPPTIAELSRPLEKEKTYNEAYHEHLREETSSFFHQLEEWKKKAVPPPAHVKERMRQIASGTYRSSVQS